MMLPIADDRLAPFGAGLVVMDAMRLVARGTGLPEYLSVFLYLRRHISQRTRDEEPPEAIAHLERRVRAGVAEKARNACTGAFTHAARRAPGASASSLIIGVIGQFGPGCGRCFPLREQRASGILISGAVKTDGVTLGRPRRHPATACCASGFDAGAVSVD
jgi:hypothetical protein